MKEVLIDGRIDKKKLRLSVGTAVVMILLGVLNLSIYGPSGIINRVLSPWLYIVVGAIYLFVPFVIYRHPSNITLSEEGIYFHHRSMPLVPWDDVVSIEEETKKVAFSKTHFLKIIIKNGEAYVTNKKIVKNGLLEVDYTFESFKQTPEEIVELLESYRMNNQ